MNYDNSRKLFSHVLLSFLLLFVSGSVGWAETGMQGWQTLKKKFSLGEQDTGFVVNENRFREDLDEFWFSLLGIGIDRKLTDYLTIGPSLNVVRLQTPADVMSTEYRPSIKFSSNIKSRIGVTTLRNINELRVFSFDTDRPQVEDLRIRVSVTHTIPLSSKTSLFLNEELLYGLNRKAWEQHRIFVGLNLSHFENTNLRLAWGIFSNKRRDTASFTDEQLLQVVYVF